MLSATWISIKASVSDVVMPDMNKKGSFAGIAERDRSTVDIVTQSNDRGAFAC